MVAPAKQARDGRGKFVRANVEDPTKQERKSAPRTNKHDGQDPKNGGSANPAAVDAKGQRSQKRAHSPSGGDGSEPKKRVTRSTAKKGLENNGEQPQAQGAIIAPNQKQSKRVTKKPVQPRAKKTAQPKGTPPRKKKPAAKRAARPSRRARNEAQPTDIDVQETNINIARPTYRDAATQTDPVIIIYPQNLGLCGKDSRSSLQDTEEIAGSGLDEVSSRDDEVVRPTVSSESLGAGAPTVSEHQANTKPDQQQLTASRSSEQFPCSGSRAIAVDKAVELYYIHRDSDWIPDKYFNIEKRKGLANKGNVCFRNSLLQCLMHIPQVCSYFIWKERQEEECETDSCVVHTLVRFMERYWSGDLEGKGDQWSAVDEFQRRLLAIAKGPTLLYTDLVTQRQGDPHELLSMLIKKIREVEQQPETSEEVTVNDMFQIEYDESWTCEDCNQVKTKPRAGAELGIDMSVAIDEGKFPQLKSPSEDTLLEKYLELHFNSTRDNRCDSTKCDPSGADQGPSKERTITNRIVEWPEVLVIHLKRVVNDGKHLTKDSRRVDFPEKLALQRWTKDNVALNYELQGVILHNGLAGSGHYTAIVRDERDRKFIYLDDETEPPKIPLELKNLWQLQLARENDQAGSVQIFDPSILFYTKI